MESALDTYRFEIRSREGDGPRCRSLTGDARALGLCRIARVRNARLYFVQGTMAPEELKLLGRFLFSDPVVEEVLWRRLERGGVPGGPMPPGKVRVVEVLPRPGVTDSVAAEILRAALELGVEGLVAASTGLRWELEGEDLDEANLDAIAGRLLANPLVERWALGEIDPHFAARSPAGAEKPPAPLERFDLAGMDEESLVRLAAERRSALSLPELLSIREHYRQEGRPATDVEFEMIAQTWSEHCVHKTFRALVSVEAPGRVEDGLEIDGILKTFIRAPSEEIAAPWVLSAFVDNAGIVALDEDHEVSFKVETHNHPSAVEPFGGANTGLGGVIRDIMGVSARPIAATDVLCFGPTEGEAGTFPEGSLHPRLIARGVVAGIEDYGNKMGIPTVNGGIHFDPDYTANPLVYCGCVGLAPRGLHRREARKGDRVVVLGGRTGRDGIRGATFSSMTMDAATGEVAGASVQIGDPIAEKKALDVLLAARDAGLYDAVTDCGAGGLSSAVGEMGSSPGPEGAALGVEVDLALLGTKYEGLAPWELWLSEAQERMVLAVPPGRLAEFSKLCELYGSEFWDIGEFTGRSRIVARRGGELVLDLPCAFLDEGLPRRRLRASPPASRASRASKALPPPPAERLLKLLSSPGIASKEAVVRLYDHEVQGGTVTRPYAGPEGDAPQDGAVIKPQGTKGEVGIAISNGFRPAYARLDPYAAAISAHDEALRNLVAVGADPERVAVLDNFCMGDPERPEVMWDLVESARGCRDAALYHRTPFISGKDSFNNEYLGADGRRHAIPPSLLISALGLVPSVRGLPSSDLKAGGNPIYLVGYFKPRFGGSSHAGLWRNPGGADETVPGLPEHAPEVYRALHSASTGGLAISMHDLSEGGLAVALAEMCLGGRRGADLALGRLALSGLPGGLEAALFGETNGCLLVEVPAVGAGDFEALLAGLPFVRIGEVARGRRLVISAASDFAQPSGSPLVDLDIGELLAAWKAVAGEAS